MSDISLELELEDGLTLEKNGLTAEYGGFIDSFPRVAFVYYVVIVPDEMIRGMDIAYMYRCFTLEDGPFDAQALSQALTYTDENGTLVLRSGATMRLKTVSAWKTTVPPQ